MQQKADQMEALTQETFARTCDTPVDYVTYCTLGAQITDREGRPLFTR
jgi:hypothetical protein